MFTGGGEKMFTILAHRIKKDIEKARKEGEFLGLNEERERYF